MVCRISGLKFSEMQSNEKEVIIRRKAQFYYSLNLKCHVKIKPTGFINGKFTSQFIEDGSYFMFQDIRTPTKSERLFIDEIFDIKDYDEPVEVNG